VLVGEQRDLPHDLPALRQRLQVLPKEPPAALGMWFARTRSPEHVHAVVIEAVDSGQPRVFAGNAEKLVADVLEDRAGAGATFRELVNGRSPVISRRGIEPKKVVDVEIDSKLVTKNLIVAKNQAVDRSDRIRQCALNKGRPEYRDIGKLDAHLVTLEV